MIPYNSQIPRRVSDMEIEEGVGRGGLALSRHESGAPKATTGPSRIIRMKRWFQSKVKKEGSYHREVQVY